MKMQNQSFLEFYYMCIEDGGVLPDRGLCRCFSEEILFPLSPLTYSINDKGWAIQTPRAEDAQEYWGYGEGDYFNVTHSVKTCTFTPLRQNIILLLAAINNEL